MVQFNSNSNANSMDNSNFVETYEVSEFKALMGVSQLNVIKSPKTGKLFFTFGGKCGKVSTKGKGENGSIVDPVISKMNEQDADGNPVYMLHERGNGGKNTLQTL